MEWKQAREKQAGESQAEMRHIVERPAEGQPAEEKPAEGQQAQEKLAEGQQAEGGQFELNPVRRKLAPQADESQQASSPPSSSTVAAHAGGGLPRYQATPVWAVAPGSSAAQHGDGVADRGPCLTSPFNSTNKTT